MTRGRRVGAVLVFVACVTAAEPPGEIGVRVDVAKPRETVTGKMAGALRLQTAYGVLTIPVTDLRELATNHDAPGEVTLTLRGSESKHAGKLLDDRLTVRTDAGEQQIERANVDAVRFRQPATSWVTGVLVPIVTLTLMEIVLGIDNIIFIAIIAGKLPPHQQPKARRLGLLAALGTRLLLLASLSFILGLTAPVFTVPDLPFLHGLEAREISWRDIILLAGGVFLIGKSTLEIHDKLQSAGEEHHGAARASAHFGLVLVQIAVIDIVFSLDSVITAVGMVDTLWVMMAAVVVSVGVMLFFAEGISRFIARRPTLKILALAFLILIGVMLVIEGFGQHFNKGYIYFAMAFAVVIEMLNLRFRSRAEPVRLNQSMLPVGTS